MIKQGWGFNGEIYFYLLAFDSNSDFDDPSEKSYSGLFDGGHLTTTQKTVKIFYD